MSEQVSRAALFAVRSIGAKRRPLTWLLIVRCRRSGESGGDWLNRMQGGTMLHVCLDCFAEWQGDLTQDACSHCGSKDVIVLSSEPLEFLLTIAGKRDTMPAPIYLYKDGKEWGKLSIQKAVRTGRNIRS